MDLEALLTAIDRTAANLERLESVWARAQGFLPIGPAIGSDPEYDDLCRAWSDLRPGLPPIDGWTIQDDLPDIDALGSAFLDYAAIGESPHPLYEVTERPGRDLAEYRFRLRRARRRAVRSRLNELVTDIDSALRSLVLDVPRESTEVLPKERVGPIEGYLAEVERLLGDTIDRSGRWSDLHRHIHFGQGHDWHDIVELDWPSVRADVDAAAQHELDPLPVPDVDLGLAASSSPSGSVTTALPWDQLDDDGFERLLLTSLRSFPDHQNVQWLMKTRAPDRGRDLSMDRVVSDPTGGIRRERVIVQAKHWLARSVAAADMLSALAGMPSWEPPVVRVLVVATSGRFSADGVTWHEKHNESGTAPLIELWPESKLEVLLSQRPAIAAAHLLR